VEKYGTATQATDDNIIQRMRFARSITKTTNTHSEYVIFIALPQQKCLRERTSILRLYVHCLSRLFLVTARILTAEYRVVSLKGCILFCFTYYICIIYSPSCAKL
jgi:hypothetical protein